MINRPSSESYKIHSPLDSRERPYTPSLFSEKDFWEHEKQKTFSTRLQSFRMRQVMASKLGRAVLVATAFLLIFWAFCTFPLRTGSALDHVQIENDLHSGVCPHRVPGTDKDRQFVLMVDAGSQGSRIHIYEFDNCHGPNPVLVHETFEETKPGLSSYGADAAAAAASLNVLLDVAVAKVPGNEQSCAPIAVKATAGLRKLPGDQADNILQAVTRHLQDKYPFPIVKDGVTIMKGSDEGVFAWVTANYLLAQTPQGRASRRTAATLDLGGASTQIVFEPAFPHNGELTDGEHHYRFRYGGREISLYQYSHLNYGLMVARDLINQAVVASIHAKLAKTNTDSDKSNDRIGSRSSDDSTVNPCLVSGHSATIETKEKIKGNSADTIGRWIMRGPDEERSTQCQEYAASILHKRNACPLEPCSFNGIYQPSLTETFAKDPIFVFSYFYDRIYPLLRRETFKVGDIRTLAQTVCAGPVAWQRELRGVAAETLKELRADPQWCLDLSYMYALLSVGYDLADTRILHTAKKIKDNELGWCLGASLPLLEASSGGWHCKLVEEKIKSSIRS